MSENVAWMVRRHEEKPIWGEVVEDVAMFDTLEHAREYVKGERVEVTPRLSMFTDQCTEVWVFSVPTRYSIGKVYLERPFEEYLLSRK